MKYKAVIFDFNGVILFDTPWHDRAWNVAAKKLRGKEFSKEEMEIEVHGRTNKDGFSYILGRAVVDKELEDFINTKEKMYQEIALKQKDFKLSPGAGELFDMLQQNKVPFTIATSSEINNVKFFFKHLPLGKWFSMDTMTFDDGIMPSKPEPDIYLKAANKIGFFPEQCLVIEDAKPGIESAFRAGIGKIIALGPKNKHEELSTLPSVGKVIVYLSEVNLSDLE